MPELAQDVCCPEITVRLMDRQLALRFDHRAMYHAELYALSVTGRRMNYLALLNMASSLCYTGLAAVIYGAAASASGRAISPAQFDEQVTMSDCLTVQEPVLQAAFDALPTVAGVPKNVRRRTANPSTHGPS